jgi:uncharacterized protein (TIGR01244 family)
MQIRRLTEQVSVSPQIQPEDMAALASAGFRSVVNNRPDGEAADQPASAELAQAAARQGLAYRHVPAVPGQFEAATVAAMARVLDDLPPPVLAFCRTGTRSTSLWALQAARHVDADVLMRTAAEAGYDLSGLLSRLHGARDA